MMSVTITTAEKAEIIQYLKTRSIPDAFDSDYVKRQTFKRRCKGFHFTDETLYYVENRTLKEVVCLDEVIKGTKIVEKVHEKGHRGVHSTFAKIRREYIGIPRYIVVKVVGKCGECAQFEPLKVDGDITPIITLSVWERIQMDLVDLSTFQQENDGYRYIANIIDCYSKYVFSFPIKTKSGEGIKNILTNLFYQEGYPDILQTDNGKEFRNSHVKKLCKEFKIRFLHGRPRHPQSQGQIERVNQTLTRSIQKHCHRTKRWIDQLPQIVSSYNTSDHTATKKSPFDLFKWRSFHNNDYDRNERSKQFAAEFIKDNASEVSDEDEAIEADLDSQSEQNISDGSISAIATRADVDEGNVAQDQPVLDPLFTIRREKMAQEAAAANRKYVEKMVASGSVHSRKSGIHVGDEVLIKTDFDNNSATRKRKMTPLFEKKGKVVMIKENGSYELESDGSKSFYKKNQIKKVNK